MVKRPRNLIQAGEIDRAETVRPVIQTYHWSHANHEDQQTSIYGWVNPDSSSPVAAIMLQYVYLPEQSALDGRPSFRLQVDLVPRPDMIVDQYNWLEEGDTFMVPQHISSQQLIEIHADTYDVLRGYHGHAYGSQLAEMGVAQAPIERMCSLVLAYITSEGGKAIMVEQGKDMIRYLSEQDIVSKDPAVRKAMVEAMRVALTSIPDITLSLQSNATRSRD